MSVIVRLESPDRDQEQLKAVASAMYDGLNQHGFKNTRIALEFPYGEEDLVAESEDYAFEPVSLLADLKVRQPAMFDTPVMLVVPCMDLAGRDWVVTADNQHPPQADDDDDGYPPLLIPHYRRHPDLSAGSKWENPVAPPPVTPQSEKEQLIASGQAVLRRMRERKAQ